MVREEVHEMVKRVGKQRKHASAAQNPVQFFIFSLNVCFLPRGELDRFHFQASKKLKEKHTEDTHCRQFILHSCVIFIIYCFCCWYAQNLVFYLKEMMQRAPRANANEV